MKMYTKKKDVQSTHIFIIYTFRFFKDRQWIFTEFPEVAPSNMSSYVSARSEQSSENLEETEKELRIFEVGCGVGNTILPILKTNNSPKLQLYGCDFATTAVELLKQDPQYDQKR
jgi:SAM-dependent methyltransferase